MAFQLSGPNVFQVFEAGSEKYHYHWNRIPTVKLKIPVKAFLKSESRIFVTFKLQFLTLAIYQWQFLYFSQFFHGCGLAKSQPLTLGTAKRLDSPNKNILELINFGWLISKEFVPNIKRFLPPSYLSNETIQN